MSDKVYAPTGAKAVQKSTKTARRMSVIGSAGPVTVQVDPGLGPRGSALAQAVYAAAEADYKRVASLFDVADPPPVYVSIEQLSPTSDGTGGAWHASCTDGVLHTDAAFNVPERTSALWIAEFAEVMQAVEGKGWDCGNTNGEGLSRVIAEWAYPGALDDYSTAAAWLDGPRPNYVDAQQGTDVDEQSNGCAVLFLTWLQAQGYTLPEIIAAGSSTLAGTYQALTGESDAWPAFSAACAAAWPPGQPSGVTSDNPWPAGTPEPPPPPTPAPGPASPAMTVSLSADVAHGDYMLVPVGPVRSLAQRARLSPTLLAELFREALRVLEIMLGPGALGSSASSTSPTSPAQIAAEGKGERK